MPIYDAEGARDLHVRSIVFPSDKMPFFTPFFHSNTDVLLCPLCLVHVWASTSFIHIYFSLFYYFYIYIIYLKKEEREPNVYRQLFFIKRHLFFPLSPFAFGSQRESVQYFLNVIFTSYFYLNITMLFSSWYTFWPKPNVNLNPSYLI